MTNGTVTLQAADQPTIVTAVGLSVYSGAWLGALCALAIALVLLSTHDQRRGAIFLVQSLAFPMAVCSALLHVVLNARNIVALTSSDNRYDRAYFYRLHVATKVFEVFTPLVCDVTLIFKVASFCPSTLYPRRWQRVRPILFLLVVAVLRLASCIMCIVSVPNREGGRVYIQAYDLSIFDVIEYGLQFFFCLYACVALSRKLWSLQRNRRLNASSQRRRKMRFLFEATAMTFALPILAQLGAIIGWVLDGVTYIAFAYSNVYLSVVCSVMATSWSTIRSSRSSQQSSPTTSNAAPATRINGGTSERALFGSVPRWPFVRGVRRRSDAPQDEDSKSTTSSERADRAAATEAQAQPLAPHETLLASIFDEDQHANSEAMEMLTSTVHRQTQLSTSSDQTIPQRLTRPEPAHHPVLRS